MELVIIMEDTLKQLESEIIQEILNSGKCIPRKEDIERLWYVKIEYGKD